MTRKESQVLYVASQRTISIAWSNECPDASNVMAAQTVAFVR
jgi:hypothetical protein